MKSMSPRWTLTEHVCRSCFGRVLQSVRPERDGGHAFRCASCGTESSGANEHVICCCGLTLEGGKRDMGVRCQRNDARSPSSKTEIVAKVKAVKP